MLPALVTGPDASNVLNHKVVLHKKSHLGAIPSKNERDRLFGPLALHLSCKSKFKIRGDLLLGDVFAVGVRGIKIWMLGGGDRLCIFGGEGAVPGFV